MYKVWNLTPHEIRLADESGEIVARFPPSGYVARLTCEDRPDSTARLYDCDLPIVVRIFGEPEGLPPEDLLDEDQTHIFIVSLPALQAVTETVARNYDRAIIVVAPDTGPTAIRDEKGQIVAVRRFIRV
ncbi:MAG: hypothetical protein JRD89_00370 [Deltaproteobacteria bacterium]|nr:hypothetical protein [Deltaproteobacteria bacterium]